jgi:hypothetical protein
VSKPHIPPRRRVDGIGEALVAGPRTLRPPLDLDDFGCLECALRVVLRTPAGEMRSAALYLDATPGRETEFLPPMLRATRWDRRGDLRRATGGKLDWPAVAVRLARFEPSDVEGMLRMFRERLSAARMMPNNVALAPSLAPDAGCTARLYYRDGARRTEYQAPLPDAGVEDLAGALEGLLSLGDPVAPGDGWRELYDYDLDRGHPGSLWAWDYRAPAGAETA